MEPSVGAKSLHFESFPVIRAKPPEVELVWLDMPHGLDNGWSLDEQRSP
jgi:hypothetical protein